MAQDSIKINGQEIYQPDENLAYSFETTYTEDSGRVQTGKGHFVPLFTVEQLNYTATNIPQSEATKILQMIDGGGDFTLHYFSMHYGRWRDGKFYVGKGDMSIGTLEKGEEKLESLSFNMTGVDPI